MTNCVGLTDGHPCALLTVVLLPELPFCEHHLPHEYRGLLAARSERYNALVSDALVSAVGDVPLSALTLRKVAGRPVSRASIARAAEVYADALSSGERSPLAEVCERMAIGPAMADYLVALARQLNLIPAHRASVHPLPAPREAGT